MKSIITCVLILTGLSCSYDKIPDLYKMKHIRWNSHFVKDICYHIEKDSDNTICWVDSAKVKFPDNEITSIKLHYTSFGLQRVEIISTDYTNDPYAILGIAKYDSCVSLLETLYKASKTEVVGTACKESDESIYKALLNNPECKQCTKWVNYNHNVSVCLASAKVDAGRLIIDMKGPYWHD